MNPFTLHLKTKQDQTLTGQIAESEILKAIEESQLLKTNYPRKMQKPNYTSLTIQSKLNKANDIKQIAKENCF